MKKIVHLIPHLSTGGCPQFSYDLIAKTKDISDSYAIEYAFIAPDFVVQRNKVRELMGDRFYSLGEDKTELFQILDKIQPDVVHIQEFPEYFMNDEITKVLYRDDRDYVIVETSHDSSFNPSQKRYFADHLALISQWQIDKFQTYGIPITLLESDIEIKPKPNRLISLVNLGLDPSKKHILNVGLWTRRKNQGEILEYARKLEKSHPKLEFHFVGNQAGNFQDYWQPLMENLPSNVRVWGERSDVHKFYECMDLFLFTSRGQNGDMETSPLVIREATSYQMPTLIYNLPVYLNYYDQYPNINYLNFDDLNHNTDLILQQLNMEQTNIFRADFDKGENKISIFYERQETLEVSISIADVDSKHAIYAYDALFENYSWSWVIPVPVHALNHYNRSGYFRGYEITIFARDRKTQIQTLNVWYDENAPHFERTLFPTDPFNLTWINYTEMFVEDFYNPLQMQISGTCLDIGANDGLYTEWLLRNGANKVYCIECDPRSVAFLNKRFNDSHDVIVVDKALWSENVTDMRLAYRSDTSTTSSLIEEVHHFNEGQYYYVNCWDYSTLKAKMNIGKVDFFKIDIEGAEYEVFKSMTDDQIKEIDGFMVEIHWNKDGKIYQITDRLEALGYEIELRRHTIDNEVVAERSEWANYDLCTFYAKKKSLETFLTYEDAFLEGGIVEEPETMKIAMHHLSTTLDTEVEKTSRMNIKGLRDFFLGFPKIKSEINFYVNDPTTELPPSENCARPTAVSLSKFPNGVNEFGQTALTPAHYGCFKAFQQAVMNFDEDAEYNIIFEGDAFVDNYNVFCNYLFQIDEAIRRGNQIDYISFGGAYHLETGELLAHKDYDIHYINFGYVSSHIPFAHCIAIPKHYTKRFKDAFINEPWDVADLFIMTHFRNNPTAVQFVVQSQVAVQLDGFSLIDKTIKQYLHK